MDFMDYLWVPFVAGVVIILIGVAIFYGHKMEKKRKEELKTLGRHLGFRFIKGSFINPSKFRGRYNGKWETEIMPNTASRTNSSVQVIKFVMVYAQKGSRFPKGKLIGRKELLSVTENIIFGKSIAHASPKYNKAFSTKGQLTRELADSWFQQRMLELNHFAKCELKVYAPQADKDGTIEFMTTRKLVTDITFANKALELMGKLADKMQGMPLFH